MGEFPHVKKRAGSFFILYTMNNNSAHHQTLSQIIRVSDFPAKSTLWKRTYYMNNSTVPTAKGEKTKYRLAESMKECMKTTPVEEITVRQICEICGVTRQTFYRNFLDKYDLINWYFDKLLAKSFEHMGRGTTVFDSLEKKFTYIQEEKNFFAAAFRYDQQNSLRQHDFELILAFYENLIQEKSGRPVSQEIHFLLEMYCQGSITMTVKWVLGGMDLTPSQLADLLVRAMPEDLKNCLSS